MLFGNKEWHINSTYLKVPWITTTSCVPYAWSISIWRTRNWRLGDLFWGNWRRWLLNLIVDYEETWKKVCMFHPYPTDSNFLNYFVVMGNHTSNIMNYDLQPGWYAKTSLINEMRLMWLKIVFCLVGRSKMSSSNENVQILIIIELLMYIKFTRLTNQLLQVQWHILTVLEH